MRLMGRVIFDHWHNLSDPARCASHVSRPTRPGVSNVYIVVLFDHRVDRLVWCHMHANILLLYSLSERSLAHEELSAIWTFNTIHEALIVAGEYKYIMAGLANPLSLSNGRTRHTVTYYGSSRSNYPGLFRLSDLCFCREEHLWATHMGSLGVLSACVYFYLCNQRALYCGWVVGLVVFIDHFFTAIATSSLAVAAGVDVVIAVFLTFLLLRKRIATGYVSTAHILQRLMLFTVNAGIWTATFALLSLILLHMFPTTFLSAVFSFPLCSVYCNTLLANLNGRAYIRGETTTHNVDVDIFTNVTSQVPDSAKGNKHPQRVVSFRTSSEFSHSELVLLLCAYPMAMIPIVKSDVHGGLSPLPVVADRPMTPTSEHVCSENVCA
ncbi:hypothetical protein OG21DRAFT_1107881 [Imleria badia]|nr:hypothetical protein OG21DRAFT_1107881 [Imleria badia]